MMKFDVVVGNPPFSVTTPGKKVGKRSIALYPTFFRRAVHNANCVAMVMPDTTTYVASEHNTFLVSSRAKSFVISQSYHKQMGIIIKTWYVIVDKSDTVPSNIKFTAKLDNENVLPIQKGKINLSTTEHRAIQDDVFSVPVIKAMTLKAMEIRFIRESDSKFRLQPGQFAVVFPLCVKDRGWARCEVVEGYGQCFNINTFYIVTNTKDHALQMKDVICSQSFVDQAVQLSGNCGTMGLGKFKKIKI